MADNGNPGNFANRPKEEVQNIAAMGGKASGGTGGGDDSNKNPGNVAGGLKATINNPNVSEEAKESAKDRLDGMGK